MDNKKPLPAYMVDYPEGWKPLLDEMVAKITEQGWDGEIRQIKEKFGGLRFYIGAASNEVHQTIEEYCERSFHICEKCGEPGELMVKNYWLKTVCSQHAQELGYTTQAQEENRPITLTFFLPVDTEDKK